MSLDYSSYLVVGLAFTLNQGKRSVYRRMSPEAAKFPDGALYHPRTGKPLFRDIEMFESGVSDFGMTAEQVEEQCEGTDFELVQESRDSDDFVVGIVLSRYGHHETGIGEVPITRLNDAIAKVAEFIAGLGADPSRIMLHHVCSCH